MTTVVLADDHGFFRAGVEQVLGTHGIQVAASVENGAAALEAIAREQPDVVVLDIRMPEPDGLTVLETLRGAGDNRPVILLAAEVENEFLLRAVKAKVDGLMLKNGAEKRLFDAITAVLQGERFVDPALMGRALELAVRAQEQSPLDTLSTKELQIAEALAAGMRNRDIAAAVGMTEGSIKVTLHRIYKKLGVENRIDLVLLVLREKGG